MYATACFDLSCNMPPSIRLSVWNTHACTRTHTVEVAIYAVNCMLVIDIFKASDVGGSMTIHMFGAYFSMAVVACLRCVISLFFLYSHTNVASYE